MKPFVKRQKNDAADAEAIVEAALRPTMRFVAVKTEDQQARAMLFRTRQVFVGQRTQMINALRGHLAEHRVVAAQGPAHVKRLSDALANDDTVLPDGVRDRGQIYLEQIDGLTARISDLDAKMKRAAKDADLARRAQTMPGEGRSLRLRSKPSRQIWPASDAGVILWPGSASCRNSTRQAGRPGWGRSRRWGTRHSHASRVWSNGRSSGRRTI